MSSDSAFTGSAKPADEGGGASSNRGGVAEVVRTGRAKLAWKACLVDGTGIVWCILAVRIAERPWRLHTKVSCSSMEQR